MAFREMVVKKGEAKEGGNPNFKNSPCVMRKNRAFISEELV